MTKELFFVCASIFLLVFGANISGTMLVPFAETLGGTSLSIGVIYASMYAVRLLLGTPIGRISEKKGAKTILKWSLMMYPFIAAAYWISWDIPSLIAARLFHGVASAMMLPMAMAYIGESSPAGEEGRYMGVYNTILFAASAAGPFAGGLIYDNMGVRNGFMTLFVFAVLSLAVTLVFVKGKTSTTPYMRIESAKQKKRAGIGALFHNRRLLALCIINIASAVLLVVLGATFMQFALSQGLDMGLIGLLIAVQNVIIGASQIPLGRVADRFDKLKLVAVSGVGAAAFVFIFPSIRGLPGIVVLTAVVGALTAINLAAITALSAVFGKETGMGQTMGILGSASSAGTIAGFLGLGWIADTAGISSAFYLAGAVFIAGVALFSLFWASEGRRIEKTSSIHEENICLK